MSYYFLLTTSVFINWASVNDTDICKYAKKLLNVLKKFREAHEDVYVEVVEDTDKSLYNLCKEMKNLEMYDIIKSHYKVADNSSGNEQDSVVKVARRISNFHKKLIIVHGSNAISPEKMKDKANIEILNEINSYKYVIQKVHNS